MLSELTHDWPKSAHHGLNTEPRRGAEVYCSFRWPELQYAERLFWIFCPMTPKIKTAYLSFNWERKELWVAALWATGAWWHLWCLLHHKCHQMFGDSVKTCYLQFFIKHLWVFQLVATFNKSANQIVPDLVVQTSLHWRILSLEKLPLTQR